MLFDQPISVSNEEIWKTQIPYYDTAHSITKTRLTIREPTPAASKPTPTVKKTPVVIKEPHLYDDEDAHTTRRKRKEITQPLQIPDRRPVRPPPRSIGLVAAEGTPGQSMSAFESLRKMIEKMIKHEMSWPFCQPVDPVALSIPDYPSIIKHPMDLGTIQSKLDMNVYTAPEQFANDITLTFRNAMFYNQPETDVYFMADRLLSYFEKSFKMTVKTNDSHVGGGEVKKEHKEKKHKKAKKEKTEEHESVNKAQRWEGLSPEEQLRLLNEELQKLEQNRKPSEKAENDNDEINIDD
ncbi:transcription factor GTE8-like [Planoprotostelium fungivorum]|uniref:Transcription factor GTE8-like n=1 Tax=Planoprotostelium fungivorum TaxID=1890364 RepID=A0A2P6N965_9EUKA|nr:transcription factor GTE8-like [Planoprotostelium fungivorum]